MRIPARFTGLALEHSTDLVEWESIDPSEIVVEPGEEYTRIFLVAQVPTDGEERLFLRESVAESL